MSSISDIWGIRVIRDSSGELGTMKGEWKTKLTQRVASCLCSVAARLLRFALDADWAVLGDLGVLERALASGREIRTRSTELGTRSE